MTDVLFGLTVKVSVLVGVALSVMPILRTRSAALRHGVLAATVVCAAGLPLLEAVVPSWSLDLRARPAVASRMAAPQASVPAAPSAVAAVVDTTNDVPAPSLVWAFVSREETKRGLGAAWLLGATLSFAVVLVGLARLAWLAGRATPVVDPIWVSAMTEVAQSFGIRRPVRLLHSDHPTLLAAWGWRRPTVMVPESARDWSDDRIRLVFSHELAHIWRGDWVAHMAAELLRSACWFNPLVWALRDRLRLESERACDDAVLRRGWKGTDYAEHLIDLARTLTAPGRRFLGFPAPAMVRPSGLERRIGAMLNPQLDRRPLTHTSRLTIAAVLSVFTVAIAGAVASAQAFFTLTGTVLDQTDRVLPDVRFVLTNPVNRSKYEVRSDGTGRFEFVGVPAGEYAVEASLLGFAVLRGNVTVGGTGSIETRVVLKVGSLEETVTVASTGRPEAARVPTATELQAAAARLQSKRGVGDCPGDTGVGGNIRQPRKLNDVRPVYPDSLSLAQVSGAVSIEGVIGTDGTMRDVRVVSATHQDFERAAVDAVRRWEFDTTLLNCQPIEVDIKVRANFQIRP